MPSKRRNAQSGLQPLIVSYQEAARLLCLEQSTVRKMVSLGKLPAVRFAGQTRASGIVYADLVAMCEDARQTQSAKEARHAKAL